MEEEEEIEVRAEDGTATYWTCPYLVDEGTVGGGNVRAIEAAAQGGLAVDGGGVTGHTLFGQRNWAEDPDYQTAEYLDYDFVTEQVGRTERIWINVSRPWGRQTQSALRNYPILDEEAEQGVRDEFLEEAIENISSRELSFPEWLRTATDAELIVVDETIAEAARERDDTHFYDDHAEINLKRLGEDLEGNYLEWAETVIDNVVELVKGLTDDQLDDVDRPWRSNTLGCLMDGLDLDTEELDPPRRPGAPYPETWAYVPGELSEWLRQEGHTDLDESMRRKLAEALQPFAPFAADELAFPAHRATPQKNPRARRRRS